MPSVAGKAERLAHSVRASIHAPWSHCRAVAGKAECLAHRLGHLFTPPGPLVSSLPTHPKRWQSRASHAPGLIAANPKRQRRDAIRPLLHPGLIPDNPTTQNISVGAFAIRSKAPPSVGKERAPLVSYLTTQQPKTSVSAQSPSEARHLQASQQRGRRCNKA